MARFDMDDLDRWDADWRDRFEPSYEQLLDKADEDRKRAKEDRLYANSARELAESTEQDAMASSDQEAKD